MKVILTIIVPFMILDNSDQYYSNLLNLLNHEDNSNDNFNGNEVLEPPQPKIEQTSAKIPRLTNNIPQNTPKYPAHQIPKPVQQAPQMLHPTHLPTFPKRTSARIFGEYVGEFLSELGNDSLDVQMKIMQVLMDAKTKPKEELITLDDEEWLFGLTYCLRNEFKALFT